MEHFNVIEKDEGIGEASSILNLNTSNQQLRMDSDVQHSRMSPPKAVIDSSPLQTAMDKNKESLKVKLLVRRTLNQLVEQGIMPSLKTSPAIYEQQRQLERAKTGDLLKAKIKKRPDRMELERRHILEHQEGNIDPSLADKKRMLEKALLVDHLNSKISHRPGPLELIEKNILHADEPIERIVKEGLVNYTSTDEAVSPAQALLSPDSMVCFEEDSLSSEGETQNLRKNTQVDILLLSKSQSPTISTNIANAHGSSFLLESGTLVDNNKLSHCPSFAHSSCATNSDGSEHISSGVIENHRKGNGSIPLKNELKERQKKKNKNKVISKTKSIKFHEYKGPPNAQKLPCSQQISGETNYQLIMKQQYLLEYLEEICKQPPTLPANSRMQFSVIAKEKDSSPSTQSNDSISTQKLPPDPTIETLNKLKVFQLKRYCKKYNLPVSGSKASLVDRLKPYLHLMEKSSDFKGKCEIEEPVTSVNSNNTADHRSIESIEENLLKEQQKRIAELQRQLKKSQEELEQIKQNQIRSQQDFISQQPDMSMEAENKKKDDLEGNEINIASLQTDKLLSEMDIKITLRIDSDDTETLLKAKPEPDFIDSNLLLDVINNREDAVDNISTSSESWRMNSLIKATNEDTIGRCNSSAHEMINFLSNKETLDKLLGQVQPGILNMSENIEHTFTNPNDSAACSVNSALSKDSVAEPLQNSTMHAPLVLGEYNDVDLLDFHMHIDDTCDTVYSIQNTADNSFPPKTDCDDDNIHKLNFESEMLNVSSGDDKMEEKHNIFNDFDGLRFVHNESYCEMFSAQKRSIVPEMSREVSLPKSFAKVSNTNDVNHNYSINPASATVCSSGASQKRLVDFNSTTVSANNIKDEWPAGDIYYDATKFKPISPESIQHAVQLTQNRSELMCVNGDKINENRFFCGDNESNNNLIDNNCNSTHVDQDSPMDFDSLLSNIDMPQNCDRAMLVGNQDKMLYDLQQNSLLEYFNDDYGMQSDTLTCGINNSIY